LSERGREKNGFFPHTDNPHGRRVLAWVFPWAAVQLKTTIFIIKSIQEQGENSSHPASDVM